MPLIAVIFPISLYSVIAFGSSNLTANNTLGSGAISQDDNKDPELLMADGTGIYGIPDLAVAFWNATACINTLKWGSTSNSLDLVIRETIPSQEHAFMLNNLMSSTTYYYSINDGLIYDFTTSSGSNDTYTFAVGSDAHFGRIVSNTTATVRMLHEIVDPAWVNNAFFFLGDLVEYGFEDSMWTQGINTFSPFTAHIPFRPILGNHDTLMGGLSSYQAYFYPTGMEENSSNSRDYYHIIVNNIHFFCLDLEWGNSSILPNNSLGLKVKLLKCPRDHG